MNKLHFLLILLTIGVFSTNSIFADDLPTDQIMSADLPFIYGEEDFIRRIEERTGDRTPVGLVLSGGSARAFAHIGVLKRMEELGIVPDYIVTNSMGSIVGLLYGAGFSPDQILTIIQSTNIGELFKLALPVRGGIIDVGKFTGLIYNFTGNMDLSELPIPVMVICEDLKTKRQVRIAKGDFSRVMRAAYALPVYFNPVEYGEHLLLDGGITNLVPLDTAYEYSDTVIASTTFYQNPNLNLRNPITNLNVALDVGKSRTGISQIKEYDPILIRCDVESFSFMEFSSLIEIQAGGYKSAVEVSGRLQELETGGLNEELVNIREENQKNIELSIEKYKFLKSIPVIEPALLLTASLKISNSPGSKMYYNNNLNFTGGADFSFGYFNTSLSGGIGTDLSVPGSFFPVADFTMDIDLSYALQLSFSYSLRFDTSGFSEAPGPYGIFGSSDIFANIKYVPVATEYFHLGLLASAETTTVGISSFNELLATVQAGMLLQSAPLSEDNYIGELLAGAQLTNPAAAFTFDNPSLFADLEFSLPLPFTEGFFKFNGRGFTRQSVSGNPVRYYLRDGMRSSVVAGEYSGVSFASAAVVFNPYDFQPTFAEVLMLKEVEIGLFGTVGWFDDMMWSAGLALTMDLSLIGLKPETLLFHTAYDSLSGGIIWGLTFSL